VADGIEEGRVRTYDMGSMSSTLDLGRAIAAAVGATRPVGAGRK